MLSLVFGGNQLMTAVDIAVVGRLGAVPMAGVGIASSIFLVVSSLGLGVVLGIDPLLAQAVGAKDAGRVGTLLWQGVWLATAVGAAVSPLAFLAAYLPELFEISAEVKRQVRLHLWARIPGLLPLYIYMALRSYLQAVDRLPAVLASVIVANLANLGVAPLLTLGGGILPAWAGPVQHIPALGGLGAGLATAFASVVQLGCLALPLRKHMGRLHPGSRWRPVPAQLRLAAVVGLPIGLQLAAEVGMFCIVALAAGTLGQEAVAAHHVAVTVTNVSFCMAIGFGAAGAVFVGRAIGARDRAALTRSLHVALRGTTLLMAISAVICGVFADPIVSALTTDVGVQKRAVPLLILVALFQVFDGLQGVGGGLLRGAGDTRFTFVAHLVGHYAIGLPIALLLGFGLQLGLQGLWGGMALGLSSIALLSLWRLHVIRQRPPGPLVTREAH